MKLTINSPAPRIKTKDILGNDFDLETYKGQKILVAFFRFSTCPFCNLRIHTLSTEYEKLGINIVAIFESSNENLRKHLAHYELPFPVLSDRAGVYYKSYGLNKSVIGVFKGMLTRPIEMLRGMSKGKSLFHGIDGHLTRMPADFLIDENGMIRELMYARDEGEHMDVEIIKRFVLDKK